MFLPHKSRASGSAVSIKTSDYNEYIGRFTFKMPSRNEKEDGGGGKQILVSPFNLNIG